MISVNVVVAPIASPSSSRTYDSPVPARSITAVVSGVAYSIASIPPPIGSAAFPRSASAAQASSMLAGLK